MANLTLNQSLPVSTREKVKLINQNRHGDVIRCLASNIEDAQNSVPIKQLMFDGAEKHKIENIIAVLVLQYARLLNVSGNLQEGQALEIAKALVEEFPYNSIDDFNVMLKRGVRSWYGTVYRFDIAVVFEWMRRYIDEFYELKERKLKQPEPIDDSDAVDDEKAKAYLEKMKKIIEAIEEPKRVRSITDQEINEEGREKPKRQVYRCDPEQAILHEKRIQWIRENFDPYTGKPVIGHISFEDWLMMKSRENK